MGWRRSIVLALVLGALGEEGGEQDTLTEEEQGVVEEDMSQYTRSAMAAMTMSMTPCPGMVQSCTRCCGSHGTVPGPTVPGTPS